MFPGYKSWTFRTISKGKRAQFLPTEKGFLKGDDLLPNQITLASIHREKMSFKND